MEGCGGGRVKIAASALEVDVRCSRCAPVSWPRERSMCVLGLCGCVCGVCVCVCVCGCVLLLSAREHGGRSTEYSGGRHSSRAPSHVFLNGNGAPPSNVKPRTVTMKN